MPIDYNAHNNTLRGLERIVCMHALLTSTLEGREVVSIGLSTQKENN